MITLNFRLYKEADSLPVVTNPSIYISGKHEFFTSDGLFSEQIFGPVNNYKCQCGKVFGKINVKKRCPKCNVLCDRNDLRSETFAKIELPEGIYIINPDFKFALRDIFGHHALKMILNKNAYNSNKEVPYFCSLDRKKLVKQNKLTKDENIIDIPVFDIASLKKLFFYIKDELSNPIEEIVDPNTGEFYTDEELEERGIQKQYKYRHILDPINEEFIPYIFLNYVLVTDPNSRQVIKISSTKIVPHPISKAYIEILKNLSKGTSILDNLYNENSDYFGNTVYKYQSSVDDIYEEILQFNFQKKENYVRESLTGKTVEFSQRAVITPNPVLRPFEIGLPDESIKNIFLPELMKFIFEKYQDKEIEIIQEGEIQKYDIIDFIQYVYDKFNSDFDIELKEEDYQEFIQKFRKDFRMAIERQPSLWKFSISGSLLAKNYGESFYDELHLHDFDKLKIDFNKYRHIYFEVLRDLKQELKEIKERSPMMYKMFQKDLNKAVLMITHRRINELNNAMEEKEEV